MSKNIVIAVIGLAVAVLANYWLYSEEVACEKVNGVYVRSVWGYKCVELK